MEIKHRSLGWPVWAMAALVTLTLSACSRGHSGETEAQLEKRYGKPLRSQAEERGKDILYRWNGYEIAVSLFDGISHTEFITKEQSAPFSSDEIKKWLEQKGAGQEWIEDRPKGGWGWEKLWHRADKKARAGYQQNTLVLDTLWLDTKTRHDPADELVKPIPPVWTQPKEPHDK